MSGELTAVSTTSDILNATETHLITRIGRQLPVAAHRLSLSIESYLKNVTRALPH